MKYSNAALPTVIGSEHSLSQALQAVFFFSGRKLPAPVSWYMWGVQKHLDTHHVCLHHIVAYHMWLWAEPIEVHEKPETQIFWAYVGKRPESEGVCMRCVHVYICVSAQVCRGSRAGRRTDRRTGCLWGQGLGGVLAGTTPDSNWVDVPWQFCTFMSLLIKVSTCWAGETTVAVPPGPPYRTRGGGWGHFLPPVPPMLTEQTSRDSCDGHRLGKGWRCQPCQC